MPEGKSQFRLPSYADMDDLLNTGALAKTTERANLVPIAFGRACRSNVEALSRPPGLAKQACRGRTARGSRSAVAYLSTPTTTNPRMEKIAPCSFHSPTCLTGLLDARARIRANAS